jgi:uncharacterized membrane protein
MNPKEHPELQELKAQHERLRWALQNVRDQISSQSGALDATCARLQTQFDEMTSRLERFEARLQLAPEMTTPPLEATPIEVQPVEPGKLEVFDPFFRPATPAAKTPSGELAPPPMAIPAARPESTPPLAAPTLAGAFGSQPAPGLAPSLFEAKQLRIAPRPSSQSSGPGVPPALSDAPPVTPPPLPPTLPPLVEAARSADPESSLEMRLGTYWLVRVGVVLLLTGLVYFGYYAYEHAILKLGPAGKLCLLYLASGALLGAGAWLLRRNPEEPLKNYAQVLFAAGSAAVYFTTYAAHHVPALRVIESALLDGVLLFIWAGVIIGIAERRKSEVMAMFAIGLAYYTGFITHVGTFTLFSNLLLTVAAVFFLVRNRWAALSFGSLMATYAGYAFWRSQNGGLLTGHLDSGEFVMAAGFLSGYWVIYTVAVFLCRADSLSATGRAGFVTLNNGAFFALVTAALLQNQRGNFWALALGFGTLLLGLAHLSRLCLPQEAPTRNAYTSQGLLLVTVGLIAKFSGYSLALILGAESVLLLIVGLQLKAPLACAGSYITAVLAALTAVYARHGSGNHALLCGALGTMFVFNAWWGQKKEGEPSEAGAKAETGASFFSALGLGIWLMATWRNSAPEWRAPILALEALGLTFSYYLLRVREVTYFGQIFLVVAQGAWLFHATQSQPQLPWWNPAFVLAVTLGLSHWWQRQTVLKGGDDTRRLLQGAYSLAVIALLFTWIKPHTAPAGWLALTSLLSVGVTVYGVLTGAWILAGCGQLFLVFSGIEFFSQIFGQSSSLHPAWHMALFPIGTLVATSLVATRWMMARKAAGHSAMPAVQGVANIYRAAAIFMGLCWVYEYIPAREQCWVYSLLGAATFALAGWTRKPLTANLAGIWFAVAFGLFPLLGRWPMFVYWPNLLAILLLAVLQRVARRFETSYPREPEFHNTMMIAAGLLLWLYVSRWVIQVSGGRMYVTISWAALALGTFGLGFVLRERVYRWLGLCILAFALGRVVLLDVWRFETLYRMLSFMGLGIVMLILGFLYNKYQERIRQWL